jgi:hypothetical protein
MGTLRGRARFLYDEIHHDFYDKYLLYILTALCCSGVCGSRVKNVETSKHVCYHIMFLSAFYEEDKN